MASSTPFSSLNECKTEKSEHGVCLSRPMDEPLQGNATNVLSWPPLFQNVAANRSISPQKSELDTREYRVLRMVNGIRVVLVSDPETDKAAAAMDVRVGYWSDPDQLYGLAHFVEHMLFMGTEKYPVEGSYAEFITTHGGRNNAYTSEENTAYYFDVQPDHLQEGLDRFAQFFLAPLFTESATEREVNAVHSEHEKNIQSDAWRLNRLTRATSPTSHPFHRFGTGNRETLFVRPAREGIDVRKELLAFHEKFYSASTMALGVVGREPLDELESLVNSLFSSIKSTQRPPPIYAAPQPSVRGAGILGGLGEVFRVVTIKDARALTLIWPMPPRKPHYKEKPVSALAHVLAHEGRGSLLSYLKARGWGNQLTSYVSGDSSVQSLFTLLITLTEEGLLHVEDVLEAVFQFIRLMRTAEEEELHRIWLERRAVSAMQFRFKGKERPSTFALGLAEGLARYAPEDILAGPYHFRRFDFGLLKRFMNALHPRNMRVHLCARSFEGKTNLTERWYGVNYSRQRLPESLLLRLEAPPLLSAMHLPPPNDFIPTDFSLVSAENELTLETHIPRVLIEEAGLRVWYKTDHVFHKPKLNLFVRLLSPEFERSPRCKALTQIWVAMLEDSLTEFAYPAEVGGLSFSIALESGYGIELIMRGFSHKLHVLALQFMERFRSLEFREDRFNLLREQLVRAFRSMENEQPYQTAMRNHRMSFTVPQWHFTEILAGLEKVTLEEVQSHSIACLRAVHVDMLFHGNVLPGRASELAHTFFAALQSAPLSRSEWTFFRRVALQAKKRYLVQRATSSSKDSNSAVFATWQLGKTCGETTARQQMLALAIKEPLFASLRTRQQLGYVVASGARTGAGQSEWWTVVQSSDHNASFLDQRVTAFIRSWEAKLEALDEKEFEQLRTACIKINEEKDKTMFEEATRHWNQIFRRRERFRWREEKIAVLRTLSHEDLLNFFRSKFVVEPCATSTQVFAHKHPLPLPGMRPRVEVQLESDDGRVNTSLHVQAVEVPHPNFGVMEDGDTVWVTDWTLFKNSMPLCPATF